MKLCKCPNCNAELSFPDEREYAFCEYCGSKIQLVDTYIKYEKVNRTIDEARIIEAQIELEKLKLEKEKEEIKEQKKRKRRKYTIRAILVATVLLIIELLIDKFHHSDALLFPVLITGYFLFVAACLFLVDILKSFNEK